MNGSKCPLRVEGAGDGWYLDAPVNGSSPPVREGTEVLVAGWYRDVPVKGSPLVFGAGTLPLLGWYRDVPG